MIMLYKSVMKFLDKSKNLTTINNKQIMKYSQKNQEN